MKNVSKILLTALLASLAVFGIAKGASVLFPYQGGTGYGTATSTDVGKVLTVASTSPFLTYSFQTPSGGGSATTTINGSSGPTFTFSTSSLGADFAISTSGSVVTWNFPSKIYSLKDIPSVLGTLAVANGSGTFNAMAPGTNGYSLIASSTAPNGLQWTPRVSSLLAGTGIGLSGATGDVTITNAGVQSIVAGTNISISNATGTVTINSTGGSVAGSDTQVQFNNGGTLGAESAFTYTTSTKKLSLNNVSSTLVVGNISNIYAALISTTSSSASAVTTYTVPAGVSKLVITAMGAKGDNGTNGGYAGENGQVATGTLAVSPGQTYYFAGAGGGGASATGGSGKASGKGGDMAWFGTANTCSTSTVLIVGSGGGGGRSDSLSAGYSGASGAAGYPNGVNGADPSSYPGYGGYGGSQTVGGAGGSSNGNAGSACQGGAGAAGFSGSGGGGAGYYGGGSGTSDGGGAAGGSGGGSSYFSPLISATSTAANSGSSQIIIQAYSQSSVETDVNSKIVSSGHIYATNDYPTVSSCGTDPSIIGNDTAGRISIGSGGITSCSIAFKKRYPFIPSCVASVASTTASYAYLSVNTTSTLTFGLSTPMQVGTAINYHCIGF